MEDEAIIARDIRQQLVALDYEPVGHATRGEEAIALAGELRPDLVLMDIQLAGAMDGIAAAHAIRTRELLAYSGRGKFVTQDIDLNRLMEEYAQLLELSVPRTTKLRLELDASPLWVHGDIAQIQ